MPSKMPTLKMLKIGKRTNRSFSNGSSSTTTDESSTGSSVQQQVQKQVFPLESLPSEVAVQVFSYLTVEDTRSLLKVSGSFHDLLTSVDGEAVVWNEHARHEWSWLKTTTTDASTETKITFSDLASPSQLMAVAAKTYPTEMQVFTGFHDDCVVLYDKEFPTTENDQQQQQQQQRPSIAATTFYQYTGRVGRGNRCVRADEPLPRPTLVEEVKNAKTGKILLSSKSLRRRLSSVTSVTKALTMSALRRQTVPAIESDISSDGSSIDSDAANENEKKEDELVLRPFSTPLLKEDFSVEIAPRLVAYFEVSLEAPPTGQKLPNQERPDCVAVGLCLRPFRCTKRMPGWDQYSIGYHSDDGGLFFGSGVSSKSYGPKYGPGDVVGCGVDYVKRCIFYTHNGNYLGSARDLDNEWLLQKELFPIVGLDSNALVHCNFNGPFKFGLEEYMADHRNKIQQVMEVHKIRKGIVLRRVNCSPA